MLPHRRPTVVVKKVYVHVGLPKTGTTYIQSALWDSRDRLASAGCLVPGSARQAMWNAASDFLGRRPRGAEAPQAEGAWDAVVAAVHAWDGDRAIVSHELLGTASRRQAQRLVRNLAHCEVHVVITVRNLPSLLPSVWQQEVRKGRTWTWTEFVTAVRDVESGPQTAGVAFWLRFDVERVVRLWGAAVPPARVHVVLVPPRGTPAEALLGRFARATGIDSRLLATADPNPNTSLGVAETEALRRLNVALAGSLNEREYMLVVGRSVVPALRANSTSTRARLSVEDQAWFEAKSREVAVFLRDHPCEVVGDLADLRAHEQPEEACDPGDLPDAMLVRPMEVALAAVSQAHARHWTRTRRRDRGATIGLPARLSSRARAVGYRAKAMAMERADHSRVFGRLASSYLKRGHKDP
jgi:hypothetical protein